MMAESTPAARRRSFGAGGPTLAQLGERALLEQLVAIAQEFLGCGGRRR